MATAVARAASPGAESRRQARVQQRRQRLLRSALGLFSELGAEEKSVGAIVVRAQMSKSAFYEHFTSKEHCFCEVLAA